jgi:seryl-tRNA synthetase
MGHFPDSHWGAICPKTNERFDFDDYFYEGEPYHSRQIYVNTTMKYPKHNGDEVEVRCSKCKETHLFQRDELLVPVAVLEADQKELENIVKLEALDTKRQEIEARKQDKQFEARIKALESDRKALERRLEEKDKLLTQKMGDLAESYLTLAKFINLEVPKLIAQAKGNRTNYETTNP